MPSPLNHPLRFKPIYRQYIWGGERLHALFGRDLPPNETFAESWEMVDHDEDQSIVEFGPLSGKPLHELVTTDPVGLFGAADSVMRLGQVKGRFPLLLKYLDARQPLSVQVHPNDAAAAELDPPDLGKTEAWLVLHSEPGSKIYAGLKDGVDHAAFENAIRNGTAEECLHSFEPVAGDFLFIRAGTVHALGAGNVVLEIQEASDTTFRLYDWNRVGTDGKPRPLHIEAGLAAVDFSLGPVNPTKPDTSFESVNLVRCDWFILDRHRLSGPRRFGDDGRCHILSVIKGSVLVENDPAECPLERSRTVLLPAAAGPVTLMPNEPAVVIDAHLPW